MKKKYLLALCAIMAVTGCKQEKPLSVLVSADYPPFTFIDDKDLSDKKDKKIVGFEIDLFNELGKRLNRKVDYVDVQFETILKSLEDGKADAAIANITDTEERHKQIDFSVPYMSSSYALIVKNKDIKMFADLKNKTLGLQKGTNFEQYYYDHYDPKEFNTTIDVANSLTDLLIKLKVGKIDAIFTGKAEGLSLIEKEKDLNGLKVEDEKSQEIAIALPKGSALKKDVDETIQSMLKDGTIESLKKKWGITL